MRSDTGNAPGECEGGQTLNQDLLAQYKQRKTGLLERLIEAYLEEAPRFFGKVRQSAQASDFAELKLNAHALKSCSYNLGAVRLSKICQSLEYAAGSKDTGEIGALLEKIGPEFFEVEEALKTEILLLRRQTSSGTPAGTGPRLQ
jgi:HPt (histidine-containing phosphotransfer) domain-containing protein